MCSEWGHTLYLHTILFKLFHPLSIVEPLRQRKPYEMMSSHHFSICMIICTKYNNNNLKKAMNNQGKSFGLSYSLLWKSDKFVSVVNMIEVVLNNSENILSAKWFFNWWSHFKNVKNQMIQKHFKKILIFFLLETNPLGLF